MGPMAVPAVADLEGRLVVIATICHTFLRKREDPAPQIPVVVEGLLAVLGISITGEQDQKAALAALALSSFETRGE